MRHISANEAIETKFKNLKNKTRKLIRNYKKPNKELLEKLELLQYNSSNMISLMYYIGYKPPIICLKINEQLRDVIKLVERELLKEEELKFIEEEKNYREN